jgi:hypothetical protein
MRKVKLLNRLDSETLEVENIQVSISLPRDLVGALDIPTSALGPYLQEVIALALFQQGRISSGKAAELMGISKLDFMHLLGKHRIPYFTESPDELEAEVSAAIDLLNNTEH